MKSNTYFATSLDSISIIIQAATGYWILLDLLNLAGDKEDSITETMTKFLGIIFSQITVDFKGIFHGFIEIDVISCKSRPFTPVLDELRKFGQSQQPHRKIRTLTLPFNSPLERSVSEDQVYPKLSLGTLNVYLLLVAS